MSLPPKRRVGPPARRIIPGDRTPVNAPAGVFVRSVRLGTGFMITTQHGFIVGRRLDKGQGTYPDCKTTGLTREQATQAIKQWDEFMELNK